LDVPSFQPVMMYADNRELRREMYEAFTTRASENGPDAGKFDNSETMEKILALKHEQAGLLGFANQAERSLAKKMARTTGDVVDFLTDLASRSKAQGEQELAELADYAKSEHGASDLEAWDLGYYSEKLRESRYKISQEELKPWFPVDQVIDGMFQVVNRLYGVSFRRVEDVDLWHEDARFYEILDQQGAVKAQFYFDLYARPKKRGGAWMDDCRGRMMTSSRQQIPVAYMVCNFTPPVGDQPALLTHREVETLFHEFGHGLHHMLTRVDHLSISGINGVAWDAVELPSQFMENFCWEREALDLFARHWETNEPIPEDLFQRMTKAKNFHSAMQMLRQLEFSLFDFRTHLEYDPTRGGRIYEVLEEVRKEFAVAPTPEWNRFAHGFSHIFAGGYAAGYYSYKWAEVLSADAFSLFEEKGIFDPDTGKAFETEVLAKGGSEDAMDLFVAFRGREPEIDALLRHTGIAN
jgi:oligopeptidase A